MGKNKDAAVGFIGIGVIIAIIAVAVMMLLPGEPETMQDEAEIETKNQPQLDMQGPAELEYEELSSEDLQEIVAGFEAYNKSVKILLDMCADVESEADFIALGSLIAEHGEKFLDVTSTYGSYRNALMAEGYGDHPELGPLLEQSEILVSGVSTCMEVLAWEFGG